MQSEAISFEWEYSKENVQPLRGGRKVDAIKKGLAKTGKGLQINANFDDVRRQEYENQIKNYNGEDPLSIWLDYIHWVEQTFPSGGSEALTLYEKCTLCFKDNDKYKSDERYLKIWLRYADLCTDPADIYTFLDANNIGTKSVMFYHHWALYFEHRTLLDKASKIYDLAIQRGAEPVEKMKKKQRAFQARFMEHMKKKMEDMKFEDNKSLSLNPASGDTSNPEEENRAPLTALRVATTSTSTTQNNNTATQTRTNTTNNTGGIRLPQSQGLAARAKATPINVLKPANNGSRAFNVFVDDEFEEKKAATSAAGSNPFKIPSTPASNPTLTLPSFAKPAPKATNSALAMPSLGNLGSNNSTTSKTSAPLFKNLAPEREKQKENTDLPSKWTDAKMVQSDVKPQLLKIKNKNESEFEVFVDDEIVSAHETELGRSKHPAAVRRRRQDQREPAVGGSEEQSAQKLQDAINILRRAKNYS